MRVYPPRRRTPRPMSAFPADPVSISSPRKGLAAPFHALEWHDVCRMRPKRKVMMARGAISNGPLSLCVRQAVAC